MRTYEPCRPGTSARLTPHEEPYTVRSPCLDESDCDPIYADLPVPTRRVAATVRHVRRQ